MLKGMLWHKGEDCNIKEGHFGVKEGLHCKRGHFSVKGRTAV